MSTTTTTITYNPNGDCPFDPAGPFDLTQGSDLQIEFSGFPSGSTLTQLSLVSVSPGTNSITFPPQAGTSGIFTITDNSKEPATGLIVTVEDIEKPTASDTYNLSLTGGNGSTGTWVADPEVINKPGQG